MLRRERSRSGLVVDPDEPALSVAGSRCRSALREGCGLKLIPGEVTYGNGSEAAL